MVKNSLSNFFNLESATGILLVIATLLAMVMANTSLQTLVCFAHFHSGGYEFWLTRDRETSFALDKRWPNGYFLFMIGLEVKREMIEGSLRDPKAIAIPAFAALGGMLVPAMIYAWFNWNDPVAIQGWAIPSATDIAFCVRYFDTLGRSCT